MESFFSLLDKAKEQTKNNANKFKSYSSDKKKQNLNDFSLFQDGLVEPLAFSNASKPSNQNKNDFDEFRLFREENKQTQVPEVYFFSPASLSPNSDNDFLILNTFKEKNEDT